MYEQNASDLVKYSDLDAKNLNKICLKIVQKVLKWPIQYENFPEAHAPRPPRTFFILNCFKIILPKKPTLENVLKFGTLPEKISEYAVDMKTFCKGLFTSFFLV